jgi:hypothetical protein
VLRCQGDAFMEGIKMNKSTLFAAAVLAACMGSSAIAADKAPDMKAAQAQYNKAVAAAKSDFDKAVAACKKQAEDKRSACYKEARQARRAARDAASDAYTNATGKPEPSPGA